MVSPTEQARRLFNDHGGTLRTGEALAAGIHPRTLYAMRDAGELEQLARGLYRLTDLPPLSEPDLATVAKRVPQAVVCLISALAYHELTTQIPHEVHLALPRTARHPILEHPPLRVFRFSLQAFQTGIETHTIDGVPVRMYGPEKTLADCFKFRNKIGLDVALEALRAYRGRRRPKLQHVLEYARLCRVEKVMRPYLEASV
ncbi:MAG: type IV toxin-antitoxin system AbiEi family antitoxin domain-containing protein [Pirellulales bacterium]